MNYASVRTCDIANGEGVRVSLFVSGCTHHCQGCFNAEAQSFDYGRPFVPEVEDELIRALAPVFISGLTLLGGEPMEPENQRALLPFLRRLRARFGLAKSIWVYTGCVLERDLSDRVAFRVLEPKEAAGRLTAAGCLRPDSRWRTEVTDELLSLVDVVVDGPFVEAEKDISLRFRGSANQRILKREVAR